MNTISVVTRDINEFLKHPLIIWAESFIEKENKLSYEQLINSTCFHSIIRSIDPRLQNSRLPNEAADTSSRLVNLDFILRSIRSFVQDVLRYIIVAKLPNIYIIAHEPYAEIKNDQLAKEKLSLQNQIQDNKIEYEKIRSELEANNKHLKLTLNTIQQREQMETTAKFQDIEQENKRLQDRIGESMQQITLPIYDIFAENLSTAPIYIENHTQKDTYEIYTTSVSSLPIDNIDSENPTTVLLQSESHPYENIESTEYLSTLSTHSADFENEETTILTDEIYYTQQESTKITATVSQKIPEFKNKETTASTLELYYAQEDLLQDFQKMLKTDIEAITKQFNPFVSISFQPVFKEHQRRAKAFLSCCQWNIRSDEILLKTYVDAYGLLDEQMKIIKDCADRLIGYNKSDCDFDLQLLEKARQLIKVFTDLYSENNTINDNSGIQLLDQAILQSIDVKNIVYDYDTTIEDSCGSALILLWKPYQLIDCEIYYRSLFANNLLFYENYNKFKTEIRQPFQQQALSLMVPVKV
ncbi:unnamed protein product [Rotaria sp. Silwood2]|nr:unnamed protein product [Rotaria sp. Silwood2]